MTTYDNPEPPIEFDATFNADDISRWYEPSLVVEQCCEGGWLPLPSGEFIECPLHAPGNQRNPD